MRSRGQEISGRRRNVKNLERKTGKGYRLTAVVLCVVMLFGMLVPMTASAAPQYGQSTSGVERIADPSTIEGWKPLFAEEEDTSNAGRIWTDKTVADGDITVNEADTVVQRKGQDNFLVGLSALSSTQEVTLAAAKPIDLMLVLDISGSMQQPVDGKAKISLLVKQVNQLMTTIQKLNPENRVGIVCFYGSFDPSVSEVESAFCLFPMDRYTTESGDYLWVGASLDETPYLRMGVDRTVKNSSGELMNPEGVKHGYQVRGSTYMQNGLLEALEHFIPGVQTSENKEGRIPIFTLITDGVPNHGTTEYANRVPSTFDTYVGAEQDFDIRISFVNQLTAAWVKKRLAESYQMSPLLYTLGIEYQLDEEELDYMLEILNPSVVEDPNLDVWWEQFLAAETGIPIELKTENKSLTVTKVDDRLQTIEDGYYVDQYFGVETSSELVDSFKELVELIKIQTAELPTEEGETGTLKFEDPIGEYMQIEQISGVMCDGVLNRGSTFAAKMTLNGNATAEEREEVLQALQECLGITQQQAEDLLGNAQEAGQIFYTSEEEFSNCISWYADGNGAYLAPYREGETAPEGAGFLNHSYFYYGTPTEMSTGAELLKLGVRTEENLTGAEQKIKFSIPSSLLPLVRYEVMTPVGDITESTTKKTEKMPIHLFYEVGIKADGFCQPDSGYPYTESTDVAKISTFYTNRWSLQGEIAEAQTTVRFEVSDKNDYYFYTREMPVYCKTPDDTFERYTGGKPQANDGNAYYYQKKVYHVGKKGGKISYLPIEADSFQHVSQAESGEWVIDAGTFRQGTMREEAKRNAGNNTETAAYVSKPALESENGSVKVCLGNNGKLVQKQGKIVVSKDISNGFAEGHDENTEFDFEVDLKPAEGEEMPTSIPGKKQGQTIECPVEEGKIKFTLKAKEAIEFWLPEGKLVSVEEVGENAKQYKQTIGVAKIDETGDETGYETIKGAKADDIEIEIQNKSEAEVENKSSSWNIGIRKLDENSNSLDGATFQLYRLECTDPNHTDADHQLPILGENEQKCWKFLSEAISKYGYLRFDTGAGAGFPNTFRKGTYRFVEAAAPKGYIVPKGQWNVTISPEDKAVKIDSVLGPNGEQPPAANRWDDNTIAFYNYKPLDPPITGGRGTWYYFLFGALAVFGGAGLIIGQIRQRKHGNS